VSGDRERLAEVEEVVYGDGGSGAVRRVLYAVYVGAILAFTYGFTVVRGVLVTSDADWVRDTLVSWPAAGVVLGAAGLVLLVVHGAGSRRGPVVPPLPWVDHVATSAIDRAASLREWWLVSGALVLAGATAVGAVVGGSLWASGATGPPALAIGVGGGLVLGLATALVWLGGQVGPTVVVGGHRDARWARPAQALRRLTLEGLRAQSVRSTHLGGAVLSGDLRAARLEVATPVRRGRRLRLRSHGPVLTVAARDVLGLRRQPASFAAGLVLVVPGAAAVAWGLVQPQVPAAVTVIAAAVLHLGVGTWSEGTRLLGDTLGTPRLSGLDVRTEAAAHLVVPGVLLVLAALGSGLVVWAAHPDTAVGAVGVVAWSVVTPVLLLGLTWVTSFRDRPRASGFTPQVGPMTIVIWYARPVLFASLGVGLLTDRAGTAGSWGAPGTWLALLAALAWWWGARSLSRTSQAHRD